MSESSSTPWQTSGSRLDEVKHDHSLNDGDLTEGLDLGFDGAEDILRAARLPSLRCGTPRPYETRAVAPCGDRYECSMFDVDRLS